MKLSQFNIISQESDNKYLLYNTLSTSLIALNKATYNEICVDHIFTNKYADELYTMGFLVDDDKDEYLEIKQIRDRLILRNHILNHVTIFLTTACNARCFYCFEKGIVPTTLTFDTCDAIIKFIYNNSNKQNINITWFGGEPLLAFDKLKYINDKLMELNIDVTSHIITNGSLINNEIIEYSLSHNIKSFQITVDAIGEAYNNIKNYVSIKNAYDVVIDNIKKLISNKIHISLRINYKINDFNSAKTTYTKLSKFLGTHENLLIYLAPLKLHKCDDDEIKLIDGIHPYLSELKFTKSLIKKQSSWKNNVSSIPHSEILSDYLLNPIGLSCGMERGNKIIINADGKLYKCHRLAGRTEYACGNVFNGIDTKSIQYVRFADSEIAHEPCKTCSLLPICHGGCKANYLLYPECDNCSPIKSFVTDLIKLYYKDLTNKI